MGKFDNILICTDLDGTLLCDDKSLSAENKQAIEYFMSEGGYFTFATGRSQTGIGHLLTLIQPNVPIVIFNGAALYDHKADKIIWETFLDKDAAKVLSLIEKNHPYSGIEVCTSGGIYVTCGNEPLRYQLAFEKIPEVYRHYSEIDEPWRKALFIQDADKLDNVRAEIAASPYGKSYNFMQSDPCYYEILPPDASKGNGMMRLADMLGVPHERTVGIGDNENDLSMIEKAAVGVAVANAIPKLLSAADFISTDNNTHSISTVIYGIEKNIIEFKE